MQFSEVYWQHAWQAWERCQDRIPPRVIVFVATAAVIYSLGHGLRTFSALPAVCTVSIQLSTLRRTENEDQFSCWVTIPAYSWTRSLNMACSEGWPSSGTKSASTKCSGQTLAKVIQHYSIININSTSTTLLYNQWQVATATVASKQRTASLLSYFKYTDRGACPNTPHSKELLLVGYLHPPSNGSFGPHESKRYLDRFIRFFCRAQGHDQHTDRSRYFARSNRLHSRAMHAMRPTCLSKKRKTGGKRRGKRNRMNLEEGKKGRGWKWYDEMERKDTSREGATTESRKKERRENDWKETEIEKRKWQRKRKWWPRASI